MIAARPRPTNPVKVNAVSEEFQVSAHAKRRNRVDGRNNASAADIKTS